MNINATIIVQMINFGIVYWLLRSLLFRPVIGAIESESSYKIELSTIIEQQKQNISIRELEREQYWYLCRQYCRNQQPTIMDPHIVNSNNAIDQKDVLSLHVDRQLIDDLVHMLEEKIKYVR